MMTDRKLLRIIKRFNNLVSIGQAREASTIRPILFSWPNRARPTKGPLAAGCFRNPGPRFLKIAVILTM